MKPLLRTWFTAAAAALALGACGGGGGGTAAPPAAMTPPATPSPTPAPPTTVPTPVPPPAADGAVHADILAGSPGVAPRYANGTLATAQFYISEGMAFNTDVALDGNGNLYVLDGNRVLRRIGADGKVTPLAGRPGVTGSDDGAGTAATFPARPSGMVADAQGNVYIADTGSIRKVTPAGVVTTLAGADSATGVPAWFTRINGLGIDAAGRVLVADSGSQGLRRVNLDGTVERVSLSIPLHAAIAVAVGADGGFAVFDWDRLLRFDAAGKLLLTLGPESGFDFIKLRSIAIGPDGLLYVVENVPIQRDFKLSTVDLAGKVTVLHAPDVPAGFLDGPLDKARFAGGGLAANGMVFDGAGNLFVADAGNYAIRKISPAHQVTTYAGGWIAPPAFADGSGTAAAFGRIAGFGSDAAGNVYVADAGNCAIRKISPAHAVTTLAGAGGQCGHVDGNGDAARFQDIRAMTQGPDGALYVAEADTVRKVSLAGAVSTLAGTPGARAKTDGAGSAAAFYDLHGIAMGPDGVLVVSDGPPPTGFTCVDAAPAVGTTLRAISPQGLVSTVAGSAWQCFAAPNPLSGWGALRFDAGGNLDLVSQGYLSRRAADGSAAFLLDDQGQRIFADGALARDEAGNLFFGRMGAVYKRSPDGKVSEVLAATADGNPTAITPDLPLLTVQSFAYLGNHRFLASFDGQVVAVTLQ